MQKTGGEFSLRLGHARVLTPHRGVIHCARAASLRLPYNQFFYHTNNAERAASLLCLIVGAIHESPVYENQIFYRRTTNGRPYGIGDRLRCERRSDKTADFMVGRRLGAAVTNGFHGTKKRRETSPRPTGER